MATVHHANPRLTSGTWAGFFLDPRAPGRHDMQLALSFQRGRIAGRGQDAVGAFTIEGRYTAESGECVWSKSYGSHDVIYRGFAEAGSIWGTWRIRDSEAHGGFQLWPRAEVPTECPPAQRTRNGSSMSSSDSGEERAAAAADGT